MNTKQRKFSFLDDEACEDDSRNIDFGISDEYSEEEDDFLDEKHYLSPEMDEDSDSVIEITPLRASTAKRTRARKDSYPKQRLSHSKIIKIKKEEDDLEIGWEDDELDELMQNSQSPVLDHKKFRIVPSSLRLIIPQEPIIVFPRSQNNLTSVLKGKVFIGIDPGVRNLGVSVAIPDLSYYRNSTHSIVKNTLQTSFDYNSVTTMLAIGVKVDSIMEEEVLNVIASINADYTWEDLVLCIEGQYVTSNVTGTKTMLFQRLLLLACRLEMSFLDWCVRKHKGLHIQRTSSQRTSSLFLKERPDCWNIICELNKQVFSGVSKDRFTKEYAFAGCEVIPESLIMENVSKIAKKPKAMRVVNLMWEIKQFFSNIPEEELPVFAKLPFASALTDHEADANLSLVVALLDILKIQNSKQC